MSEVTAGELESLGLKADEAAHLSARWTELAEVSPELAWQRLSQDDLKPSQPFAVHLRLYQALSERWDPAARGPLPAWLPSEGAKTNARRLMQQQELSDFAALHAWSVQERGPFWGALAERIGFRFAEAPSAPLDASPGVEDARWFPGARLNATQSCFQAAGDAPAIVFQREGGELERWSYDELRALTGRVANGLVAAGFSAGDAIAIDMPMTPESVAIYLGIIRAGCAAISIADSFSPAEIATRLRIGAAKGVFTQDVMLRAGKTLPLFAKVQDAEAPRAIVLPATPGGELQVELRAGDLAWGDFLSEREPFADVLSETDALTNVLFSSGTTGEPKAIPWTQLTPLKAAADGHLHHDIRPGEVVCWPTNLGWMMGPWLIYAALINRATIALYCGAPTGRAFGVFVQDAAVTMLGVVPSLVATWRATGCLDSLDWSSIRCFSSTGECSNPEDMLWLMSLAGYKPVIEYCGGTEIGGGYLTGCHDLPAAPGHFSTPACGLDLVLIDDEGQRGERGEVFLVAPSVGLSQRLLNRDHHEVYFAGTPSHEGAPLRRHGDWLERLPGGFWRAQGRVDDTMNLGGIKVSSAEIEELLNNVEGVHQTAAIAVPTPGGGPSKLVVYAEAEAGAELDAAALTETFRGLIKRELNPLFKVSETLVLEKLPRTASNKVMRRELRARYLAERT
ncbi:MAG TPA: AMP-dependent synthetase [Planctomycetes bacterium]|nr:AMP-dependent synthetase [Planctomycetota bacterium]